MSKGGGGFFVAGAAGGAGGGSVTSNEASAISAQAASAINVVSDAVSALSQQNSVEHAALSVRIDTQSQGISVLSQAVSVVSQQVSANSNSLANLSVRTSLAGASVKGLQSVLNAISNRISIEAPVGGGGGSVTSAEVSAVSAQAASAINVLSVQVALVEGRETELVWEQILAGDNVVVTPLAGGKAVEISVSVTSNEVSVAAAALSVRIDTVSQGVSVLSQAVSVISQQVSVLSQAHSALSQKVSALSVRVSGISAGLSVRSVGAISTKGMQSILNALSNRISAGTGGSATPTSAAYVSLVSTVSHLASIVSGVSARNTAAVSVKGLQSIFNALSNRISAAGGGAGSVTSAEYSVRSFSAGGSAGTSVKGFQSVFNTISNTFSNAFSAGSVISSRVGRIARLAAAATVSAVTLTDISGLSLAVSAGAHYIFDAMLLCSTSVAQPIGFGMTFPAMTMAGGVMQRAITAITSAATQSVVNLVHGMWTGAGSGSIIISSPAPGVAGGLPVPVFQNGVFLVSTAGTLQLQANASTGTGQIVIEAGSYMRLAKLN